MFRYSLFALQRSRCSRSSRFIVVVVVVAVIVAFIAFRMQHSGVAPQRDDWVNDLVWNA